MIEIPWQLAAVIVAANCVIVLALIYFIRDMTQARNQDKQDAIRQVRATVAEGIKEGHNIYLDLLERQRLSLGLDDKDNGK